MKKHTPPENIFDQLVIDLTPQYGLGEARSIARIVFEDAFGLRNGPYHLSDQVAEQQFIAIRQRLLSGEPVQYVLGEADFFGFKFKVSPDVLIPRQETEELVAWAIEWIKNTPARVLDIGTGSGCIAITIAKKCQNAAVFAIDKSESALYIARENAENLSVSVNFSQQDILNENTWSDLPAFDFILSNPPYIPRQEAKLMPRHVLKHEPHLALFVDDGDPLLFYRAIARFARLKLHPGGRLMFECNEFNARQVYELLVEEGFSEVELRKDLSGADRMVNGIRRHPRI
ncbi:MAG: peptide chain release factor N(5)-glutamine methyltransferase [Saprospiraceae bacterium]|nr:peptide chain release factor N(5)-glutamine methyltransferase [Saprospiraceae bacterium]